MAQSERERSKSVNELLKAEQPEVLGEMGLESDGEVEAGFLSTVWGLVANMIEKIESLRDLRKEKERENRELMKWLKKAREEVGENFMLLVAGKRGGGVLFCKPFVDLDATVSEYSTLRYQVSGRKEWLLLTEEGWSAVSFGYDNVWVNEDESKNLQRTDSTSGDCGDYKLTAFSSLIQRGCNYSGCLEGVRVRKSNLEGKVELLFDGFSGLRSQDWGSVEDRYKMKKLGCYATVKIRPLLFEEGSGDAPMVEERLGEVDELLNRKSRANRYQAEVARNMLQGKRKRDDK